MWKIDQNKKIQWKITEISTQVLDKNAIPIGEKKYFNSECYQLLTDWVERPKTNKDICIPLKNALTPATTSKDLRGTKWADNALGWLNCPGNDLQQAGRLTCLLSSGFASGRGFFVTPENLWKSAIIFSVRLLIKPTWLNDRDQFLQPKEPLTEDFKTDCLIWMLFHSSNLTASANDLEWNNSTWSIVNNFIPFTEQEVNSPDRFESDFMQQYLQDKKLSKEAISVLNAGKKLWTAYFENIDSYHIREEFKLNRSDVGWYQIRNALKLRNASEDFIPVSFKDFEDSHKKLGDKLRPKVYDLGFLIS